MEQKTLSYWLCLAVGLASSTFGQSIAASSKQFRAGAATSNITPHLGEPIVGNWNSPPASHIHDELHARCLVLDDGATQLVFVVVDNLGVSRDVFDEAKLRIHQATGLPPEHMMMSATHTHSATRAYSRHFAALPSRAEAGAASLDDYQRFLVQRIVDGVRRAINHLEPARIGWGAGRVPHRNFNRRWLLKEGLTVANPFGGQDRVRKNAAQQPQPDLLGPAGPTNPEVYFLSVQSTDGRPIALLANFWIHYVGAASGHVSADYFGAFGDRIRQLLSADNQDPPFVGILANGPCGDLTVGPRDPQYTPYEKMRVVANDVAQEVLRVYRTTSHHDWVELKAAQAELELRTRRPSVELIQRSQEVLARPATASPIHRLEATYAERVLTARDWPETVSIILQTFRIGGLGIAAIPFEVFAETGLEIKAKSPFADTFTIELANGYYGYLPTPEQHAVGGYETWLGTNRVEIEASRKITAKLLSLFAQMK